MCTLALLAFVSNLGLHIGPNGGFSQVRGLRTLPGMRIKRMNRDGDPYAGVTITHDERAQIAANARSVVAKMSKDDILALALEAMERVDALSVASNYSEVSLAASINTFMVYDKALWILFWEQRPSPSGP